MKTKHCHKPLISVIVPVYNANQTLGRAIQSVLDQTHVNLELILSDDGSTDGSDLICQEYQNRDARIRYTRNENHGPSAARNRGLELATGDFIAFLDADDCLIKDALENLIASQQTNDADMVVGDFIKFQNSKKETSGHDNFFSKNSNLDRNDIKEYVQNFYLQAPNRHPLFVYIWGRLIKSEIIKGHKFKESMYTYEDVDYNFQILPSINKLNFVARPMLEKHTHVCDGHNISKRLTKRSIQNHFGYMTALKTAEIYLKNQDQGLQKPVSRAFAIYTIITLIRLGKQMRPNNLPDILNATRKICNDHALQHELASYRPSKGESKIIPALLKYNLPTLLIFACAIRSHIRYR